MWGQDVISISRNKIGLFSLSRPAYEVSIQGSILSILLDSVSLHYGVHKIVTIFCTPGSLTGKEI